MGLKESRRKRLSDAIVTTHYHTIWLHCGRRKVEVDLSKPLSDDALCLRCKRKVNLSTAHILLCWRCREATIYKVTSAFCSGGNQHGRIVRIGLFFRGNRRHYKKKKEDRGKVRDGKKT